MSLCISCKLKVFSHFTCPGLCYSLSAKTIVFTAQARVTMISPSEESGGCLPWGHWGGNWVFRASVTFFWICLPLTQSVNMAGTSTKSSITSLPCLSKPSVGISPSCPQSHRDAHDALSLSTQSQKVLTPHLTCHFTCESSGEKSLSSSEVQALFSLTRLNKIDCVEREAQ